MRLRRLSLSSELARPAAQFRVITIFARTRAAKDTRNFVRIV